MSDTPEQRARATRRRYYLRNREKIIASVAIYNRANRDRKNASKRKRYRERHDHFLAKSRTYSATRRSTGKQNVYQRRYRSGHRESTNAYSRQYHTVMTRNLTDAYITQLLRRHGIPASQKNIQHRRAVIAAKRMAKFAQITQAAIALCPQKK